VSELNITQRPVIPADEAFLYQLYASTRDREMAQIPWTAAQKAAFLEMQFRAQLQSYTATHPRASHVIICDAGQPVGRLYLDRSDDGLHILDITIAPECRNQGIGPAVLQEILAEAAECSKPVSIYVETFNPSLQLFERLNFRPVSEHGFQVLLRTANASA